MISLKKATANNVLRESEEGELLKTIWHISAYLAYGTLCTSTLGEFKDLWSLVMISFKQEAMMR
jgi:hypothetical protein